MTNTEQLPRLLTVPEVAELLGVNQGKVHELRKSGLLPFLKLGAYKCGGVFKEILIGVYFTQPEKGFALPYFVQLGE